MEHNNSVTSISNPLINIANFDSHCIDKSIPSIGQINPSQLVKILKYAGLIMDLNSAIKPSRMLALN